MTGTARQMVELLEGAGFVLCHTWRSSNSNSGQYIMQRPAATATLNVCFRGGVLTNVFTGSHGHDYLKARDILKDLESEEGPEYFERVGPERTSPCCTASWFDVRQKWNKQCYRIQRVAGHGTWAVKIEEDEAGKVEE